MTALRSLTRDDVATVLARQVDEKVWTYGVLWDLRRMATMATVFGGEIGELSDQMVNAIGHLGPRGPVAIVAWSHQVIEGARFYGEAAGAGGLRLQVFPTVADAERWLDEQGAD